MTPKEAVAVLKAAFRVPDLEPETIRLYVSKLGEIPGQILELTIHRVIERAKFFPTIAEIYENAAEIAPVQDGHLPPEEAWASVANLSEEDSIVWTAEMAEAFGTARKVLPDRVGARMAFLDVYRRLVADARREGRPADWWASLGWAVTGRSEAVREGVVRGRLTVETAMLLLLPEDWEPEWARALPGSQESAPAELAP